MIKIPLYDSKGEKIDELPFDIDEKRFVFNQSLVAQAAFVESRNVFGEFGRAKTRSEVRGGGRKPWRQKGTGRARAGSIRSPLFKGGGVTFGPTGESQKLKMPKKMRHLALQQLVLKKAQMGGVSAVEDFEIKSGKTKDAQNALLKICNGCKCTLVVDKGEAGNIRPWNNIPLIDAIRTENLRILDVVQGGMVILSKKYFEKLKESYKK